MVQSRRLARARVERWPLALPVALAPLVALSALVALVALVALSALPECAEVERSAE